MAEYRQSSATSFLDGFSFPESRAELQEKVSIKYHVLAKQFLFTSYTLLIGVTIEL